MKRLAALLAAFICLAGTGSLVSVPAFAASDASISGTVTATGGGDVDFVRAEAWAWTDDTESWDWYAAADVDSETGAYSIAGLEPDTDYKVFFSSQGRLLSEFYDDVQDVEDAQIVATDGDGEIAGIDAELAVGQSISGTVTASDAGSVADVRVEVYAWDGWEAWRYSTSADVDATTGRYTVLGLEPNIEYKLYFSSSGRLLSEYYADQDDLETAETVTVADGGTAGIDATLAVGGSMTGEVALPTGLVDPWANVTAYRWNDQWNNWEWVSAGDITAEGSYTLQGLRSGEYLVEFGGDERLAKEYYDDAFTTDSAQLVTVEEGEVTTGIDAAIDRASSISGKVTVPSGVSAKDVTVTVFRAGTASALTTGIPASNGNYTASGLPSGSYSLRFTHSMTLVAPQYYAGKSTRAQADPVTLGSGQAKGGIDVTMAKGATISGRVTLPAQGGDAPDDYYGTLRLWVRASALSEWELADTTDALDDGKFRFVNVPDGQYTVEARAQGRYSGLFWQDAASLDDATAFTIAGGVSRTGVDLALESGATISGRLTGSGGENVAATVKAYRWDASTRTWLKVLEQEHDPLDEDSHAYVLSGLSPGTYRVGFVPSGSTYLPQYFNGKPTLQQADDIVVARQAKVTGIDATLAPDPQRGAISGTVTVPAGADLSSTNIEVFPKGNRDIATFATPDSSGDFHVRGLKPGKYTVAFSSYEQGLLDEYFDNAASLANATTVVVKAGEATTDIDATLETDPAFGSISGTMLDTAGTAVDGYVGLWRHDEDFDEWEQMRSSGPGANGSWSFRGLEPGDYAVEFNADESTGLLDEFFDDASSVDGADLITVTAGHATTGVDGVLTRDTTLGAIGGTVTTQVGPLEGGVVEFYRLVEGSWEPVRSVSIRANGSYREAGLTPGDYKIRFLPDDESFASEYYDDKATLASANVVKVLANQDSPGIDAELACAGVCPGAVIAAGSPTLSGTAKVGSVLTVSANAATWSPSGLAFGFQWYRVSAAGSTSIISGETNSTYTVTATDEGSRLFARVTATREASDAVSADTPRSSIVAAAILPSTPAGNPAVSGGPRVGQLVTVTPGTPVGASVAVEWSNGLRVVGRGTSYRLAPGDVGRKITVKLTYAATAHEPTVVTKTAVPSVAKALPALSVAAKGAKRSATFRISVTAPGVAPTGKVTIKLGKKTLKTVALRNGTVSVTLKKLPKGKKKYTIVYAGGNGVASKTTSKTVKVK